VVVKGKKRGICGSLAKAYPEEGNSSKGGQGQGKKKKAPGLKKKHFPFSKSFVRGQQRKKLRSQHRGRTKTRTSSGGIVRKPEPEKKERRKIEGKIQASRTSLDFPLSPIAER